MSDYIPTTEDVRDACYQRFDVEDGDDAFDRWLTQHDAHLREQAWNEGYQRGLVVDYDTGAVPVDPTTPDVDILTEHGQITDYVHTGTMHSVDPRLVTMVMGRRAGRMATLAKMKADWQASLKDTMAGRPLRASDTGYTPGLVAPEEIRPRDRIVSWEKKWETPTIDCACPSCGRRAGRKPGSWTRKAGSVTARMSCWPLSEKHPACWRTWDCTVPVPTEEGEILAEALAEYGSVVYVRQACGYLSLYSNPTGVEIDDCNCKSVSPHQIRRAAVTGGYPAGKITGRLASPPPSIPSKPKEER